MYVNVCMVFDYGRIEEKNISVSTDICKLKQNLISLYNFPFIRPFLY